MKPPLPRTGIAAVVLVAALTTVVAGCGFTVDIGSGTAGPGATATITKTVDPVVGDPAPGIGSGSTPDLITLRTKGFSVGLPYNAQREVEHFDLNGHQQSFVAYASGDGMNGGFVIARVSYPRGYVVDLEGAFRGGAAQLHGVIRDDRSTTFKGHPARTGRIHGRAKGHVITMFVLLVNVDEDLFEVKYVLEGADRKRPPAVFKQVIDTIVLHKGAEDGTQSS